MMHISAHTSGNLALITGASSGIGAAFARELAARKYDLILVARRRERLESLSSELREKYSVICDCLVADLASDEGIATVAARIRQADNLVLLINNAGFGTIGDFVEVDCDRHLTMITVHVQATVRLSHAALPGMIANGRGDIINVSSVSGFMENPGGVTYNATKAFLNTFSRSLHNEVREFGLRVQALCPGFTVTEFHEVGDFMGFDRNEVPQRWWLAADDVVRKSLADLEKGTVICIPHIRYKCVVAMFHNRLITRLLRSFMKRKRWRKR